MGTVSLALRREPLDVLPLIAREPGAFMLSVPDPDRPTILLGCRPTDELRVPPTAADPLAEVAAFVGDAPALDPTLPFPLAGGIVGYLAYEAGRAVAPRAQRHRPDVPLAVLRRYDPILVFDVRRRQYSLVSSERGGRTPHWLCNLNDPTPVSHARLARAPLTAALAEDAYGEAIARILEYLAAGDIYQANFTQPLRTTLQAPAWVLFDRLTRGRWPAHAAYLDLDDFQVVCTTPELLLRRRADRIETRPIKGTRPRGSEPTTDSALAAALMNSPKERAEHVMIVDLERNDLGRVCRAGSVVVERLAQIESLPTVHHLVSTIRGTLDGDVSLETLLGATFPGGSVTGAPKVRAMEIIAELESEPRGIYTGALGMFDPRGDLELGLPIRTAVVQGDRLTYRVGGGIVADSTASGELAECWLKAEAVRHALGDRPDAEIDRCSSG